MRERKLAYTVEEAAECTGIGRNTLRQLIEWKKLPVLKVGRKLLIRGDTMEDLKAGVQQFREYTAQL